MAIRRRFEELKAAQASRLRLPDSKRLASGDGRPRCDYIPCSEPFSPVRSHQRFCKDVHRVYAWQRPETDRKGNRRATRPAASVGRFSK
jgi:hypothetical protein